MDKGYGAPRFAARRADEMSQEGSHPIFKSFRRMRAIIAITIPLLLAGLSATAFGASDTAVGGGGSQVRLNFSIRIKPSLFLKIEFPDDRSGVVPSDALQLPLSEATDAPGEIAVKYAHNQSMVLTVTSPHPTDGGLDGLGKEWIRQFAAAGIHSDTLDLSGTGTETTTYTMCSP